MKIQGGSPFRNIRQPAKTSKAGKAKSKGKAFAKKADDVEAVEAVETVDVADEVDSPYYDAMSGVSQDFEEGNTTFEEATRAVVSAVLEEHFGKKNLPQKQLDDITEKVSNAIATDSTLQGRLDTVLRRIAISEKKRKKR